MECYPDRSTFRHLAGRGNLIPVYTDLMADFETPVSAYAKLSGLGPSFLFESIEGGENIGRYTFLGCRPGKIFAVGEKETRITLADGSSTTLPTPADPLTLIQEEMARFRPVDLPGLPPFTGGAVGAIAYEYVHRLEPTVTPPSADDLGLPLLYFLITDSVVVFDRVRQTLRILYNAHVDGDPDAAYDRALQALRELFDLLRRGRELSPLPLAEVSDLEIPAGNFTRPRFEQAVADIKEFIRAGDIIQAVLSQRFTLPYDRPPLDLYRALRIVNPSPYMFLLETGDFAIVGASPEVHVRLTGRKVEIRPIAGTRPRGRNPQEDQSLERDLLADEKERAEHLMLVDLARNDIGRVCVMGSVEVPEFMVVERYSHVMHIVSQVTGELDPAHTAYDLMRATFPAGTVSGAPKIRAMQIIAAHEPARRGFYAGALGYFSYHGNCDSCIAIRTAVLLPGTCYLQAGAGLVYDSIPAGEYLETVNKARAILKAVALARQLPV